MISKEQPQPGCHLEDRELHLHGIWYCRYHTCTITRRGWLGGLHPPDQDPSCRLQDDFDRPVERLGTNRIGTRGCGKCGTAARGQSAENQQQK